MLSRQSSNAPKSSSLSWYDCPRACRTALGINPAFSLLSLCYSLPLSFSRQMEQQMKLAPPPKTGPSEIERTRLWQSQMVRPIHIVSALVVGLPIRNYLLSSQYFSSPLSRLSISGTCRMRTTCEASSRMQISASLPGGGLGCPKRTPLLAYEARQPALSFCVTANQIHPRKFVHYCHALPATRRRLDMFVMCLACTL